MAENKKISKIKVGNTTYDIKDPNQPAAIVFDGDYSATTNKAATVQTVTDKINTLDGGTIGTPGSGKTITALSQTNGNISATFGNISITKSQVSDFPTSMPASDVSAWAKAANKPSYTASEVNAIPSSQKGANSGVAELDSTGKVPSSQLPSFVDDVLEYDSLSNFPTTGESGKIYIAKDTNKAYRWSGTAYVEISSSLALGETSSTAYRGDRGKTAYDHSQSTHARTDATNVAASSTNGNIKINGTETTVYTHPGSGTNPHGTTKSDVGLSNVGNFKAVSTVASQGLTDTEKSNARTNIGAGTSNLTIGTTASTAAAGNHNHDGTYLKTTDISDWAKASSKPSYTASEVGLGNVGNFKAVSTVANQGLTSTEKSNARANIGAGTSSLTIGTTGTTAAAGNHTHDYSNTYAAKSHTHTVSQITDFPESMPASDVSSWAKADSKPSYTYSEVGAAASNHSHSVVSSGTSTTTGGFMSQADKQKLDGIAAGATANVGTITGIKMNGSSKGTSGVVDLGTVITSHQDISGKADKSATVSNVAYDSTNAKITETINGTTSDVVTVATLKSALGSMPASDVYSWAKASTKPSYTASEVGAATSGHTHTTSLATDTGTSTITLASAGKYKLTAGGTSVIFTMPTIPSVSYPVTSVNNKTGAVNLTASDVGASASGHTHTTSLATSTGTSTITLAANAKYQLTAGGTSVIFTTPSNPDYSNTYAPKTHTHTKSQITDFPTSMPASDVSSWAKASSKPTYTASEVGAIAATAKGANSGVAELDATGKVPSSQLPSFVDDVLEYNSQSSFPTTGETGKIYIAKDTNKTYRWSGTAYVEIGASLALGETSSTAYRGDRGKTAYDHSKLTSGNPHNVTKSDVGLGNVGNFKAVSTEMTQGLTDTEKSNARANIGAGTSNLTIGNTDHTAAAGNHGHALGISVYTPVEGEAMFDISPGGAYKATVGNRDLTFNVPSLSASDVGLGNVGNFKAVSTVASQGLTTTEKSNARANIGAGTSSLTIGTTSTTAAAGNHTHDYSNTYAAKSHTHDATLTTDTGTSSITLASNGKYKLTAGGDSVIFTMPTIPSVSYPVTSVAGKTGAVTLTSSDVGLGNVGNFKAVSTVASQGLTDTEKYNARANIGAGTSSLTIGTTSSTAAAGNHTHDYSSTYAAKTHTHTTSLAVDTGTSTITLASAGKYKLTAGDTSVIFTMPTIPTVNYPVTSVNTKTGAVSLTYSDVGAASSGHTHDITLASDSGTSSVTLASAGKYKLTAGGKSVIFTMPTIPTVNYPVTSVAGKTGAVTLASSDVGLGNVGNFKAVSTVASQGLTDTEKSNARTNIGAGTSSLTIGTSGSTAAAGNHTHTTSLTTSTGTSSVTLAHGGKYSLTAGGNSVIFTMPEGTSVTPTKSTIGSASAGTAIPADDITNWSAGSAPTLTVTSTSVITNATVSGTTLTLSTGTVGSASGWSAGSVPTLSYTAKSIPNISVTSTEVVTDIS